MTTPITSYAEQAAITAANVNKEIQKNFPSSTRKVHVEVYEDSDGQLFFQLIGERPKFVLRYLRAEYLNWHLLYLITGLVEGVYTAGTEHGLEIAGRRIHEMFTRAIGRKPLPTNFQSHFLTDN